MDKIDKTITERQRKYRERMYKAGFKQIQIWVKREERKRAITSMTEFMNEIKRLTAGWEKTDITRLLNLMIKITRAKKEEEKQRKRNTGRG